MALSKSVHIFFIRYIPSIVYANMKLFRWHTFLLRQKDRPTYQRALQILIEQQEELQPGSMCDFEKAFHQALEDVFGEKGNIKGCYFHLSQSIWGRFQKQNLVQTYKENEELRLKMKMLAALAFVPTNLVLHYLEVLSDDIPAELELLYDYFEDNYLGRPSRHGQPRASNFAIEIWSMYQQAELGLSRTNNAVEGWHRAFQHTVGYVHPTVYKLINSMRLEQSHTENLKAKIDAGQNLVTKNQKYVRVTAAIRRLVDNFNQRKPLDYLRGISHNIELNV